ncbi:MAG: alpha/beta hydrolase [Emcibacter sp.]|nr:alpha/beta hydrolase [Emcibacter sp.]
MDNETLTKEYSPSSCIDDVMVYIRQYEDQSRMADEKYGSQCHRNIKYGPAERAHMDIFAPKGRGPFPVHIFIHGGYWQELSKAESLFAAPNFLNHDIIFIALDYTLAPQASLYQIVDEVRQGVLWCLNNIADYNGDNQNITLSGSSAGAHLVAETLGMDWTAQGYDTYPIKGACEVSGIYDLRPLVPTYVNDPLHMTVKDATALSPLFHIPEKACPVIFSVGGNETNEFKRQTHDYQAAWKKAGHEATIVDMSAFNHFDIILELNNENSPLFKTVLAQML